VLLIEVEDRDLSDQLRWVEAARERIGRQLAAR
jgi:hypothetical protein